MQAGVRVDDTISEVLDTQSMPPFFWWSRDFYVLEKSANSFRSNTWYAILSDPIHLV